MAEVLENKNIQQPAAPAAAQTPAQPKAEEIAESFLAALEARQQRTERSVTKSLAEQYGLAESEVAEYLQKAKAAKEARIPEAAQKQIDEQREKLNKLLVSTEVKAKGAALGLLDVDTAMLLMDREKVKVSEEGAVTGVDEALGALKKAKPFLFTPQPTGRFVDVGGAVITSPGEQPDGVEAAFLRRNPDLKI